MWSQRVGHNWVCKKAHKYFSILCFSFYPEVILNLKDSLNTFNKISIVSDNFCILRNFTYYIKSLLQTYEVDTYRDRENMIITGFNNENNNNINIILSFETTSILALKPN